jgi:hypothetical protein
MADVTRGSRVKFLVVEGLEDRVTPVDIGSADYDPGHILVGDLSGAMRRVALPAGVTFNHSNSARRARVIVMITYGLNNLFRFLSACYSKSIFNRFRQCPSTRSLGFESDRYKRVNACIGHIARGISDRNMKMTACALTETPVNYQDLG